MPTKKKDQLLKVSRTERGFKVIMHPSYPDHLDLRLVQCSSAVGDYDNSLSIPGSSYLWIGDNHHLNREEVAELVTHMQNWLSTGTL